MLHFLLPIQACCARHKSKQVENATNFAGRGQVVTQEFNFTPLDNVLKP